MFRAIRRFSSQLYFTLFCCFYGFPRKLWYSAGVTPLRASLQCVGGARGPGGRRAPAGAYLFGPARPSSTPSTPTKSNMMTPADLIVRCLLALTLPYVFNATTPGDARLFPWSHHAWFRVAAASRRCSLSEQRRDASATFAAQVRQVLECARASLLLPRISFVSARAAGEWNK